ncbi:hypothetical protein ACB295_21540, partial [Aeromonas caviae]
SGAILIVARRTFSIKTPDRFKQANHNTRNQGCKKGGDHRFLLLGVGANWLEAMTPPRFAP